MRNKIFKNLCIILVSFKSKKKVEKTIKNLNKKISVILVENSKDISVKKDFEKKYKNLKVIIPKSNDGQGAAFNLGAKLTNKKYLLFIDMDIDINDNQIISLMKKAAKVKNFGVLTPKIKNHNYKNSILSKKENNLFEVNFNHGAVMLIKKNILKKIKYFDENIFLYFEESDIYQKCRNKGLPVYMFDKVIVTNPISKAIDNKYIKEYLKIRNWHYCWSKFYYYKKHQGYLNGLYKTLPNLIRSIKKILICVIKFRFKEIGYFKAEISGLFCSYLNLKSFYRMKN